MTVKQYIRENGWQSECTPKMCRVMSVNIGFINDKKRDDETEFDIRAYDTNELSNLFQDFCRENGFPQNTVTDIVVLQMADNMEDLE